MGVACHLAFSSSHPIIFLYQTVSTDSFVASGVVSLFGSDPESNTAIQSTDLGIYRLQILLAEANCPHIPSSLASISNLLSDRTVTLGLWSASTGEDMQLGIKGYDTLSK